MHSIYVLHTRPYRDTSLLVDLFSREHGRITAVARGVRGPKSRHRGLLQPFTPLLVSWFGKSDLVTLNGIEPNGIPHYLTGNRLLSGLYINELLVRALHHGDPHPALYDEYATSVVALAKINCAQEIYSKQQTICGVDFQQDANEASSQNVQVVDEDCELSNNTIENSSTKSIELILRLFEKRLLQEIGYGGENLNALTRETLITNQHFLDAKRLMRTALLPIIGKKPLKSRELFVYQA